MPNHTGRLVLTTTDPLACPEASLLIESLSRAGFIAAPLPGHRQAYTVGANFLSLLAFSGCAVVVPTTTGPAPYTAFCHVRISTLSVAPR